MRIVVLGASGTLGTLLVDMLRADGHEVLAASRSTGVDAFTGRGLQEAFAGADAVIDSLNQVSLSAAKSIGFFTTTAGNICAEARRAGVGRLVCVSIAGAADGEVNKAYGYYQGKAAQEHAYRSSGLPVTVIHSTQWFELVPMILQMTTLGPVALMPTMRMAPVAAQSVARLVAQEAVRPAEVQAEGPDAGREPPVRTVAIRGPETATGAEVARRMVEVLGSAGGKAPRRILEAPLFGRAMAGGGLIPEPAIVDGVTLDEWMERQRSAPYGSGDSEAAVTPALDPSAEGVHTDEVLDAYDYVIVGAGMAAAKAIEGIRAEDPIGSIGVFGTDTAAPVYRPDLSKTLWVDPEASLEGSLMISGAAGSDSAPDAGTQVHLGTTVASLAPDERSITLAGGRSVRYGKLLLATGAEPRTAGLEPGDRVIYYRTVADYRRLRALAVPGAHVVVVGGGYIGSEVAAVLTQNRVRVTLVATGEPLLAQMFPESLARTLTRRFRDRGVEIVVGRLAGGSEGAEGVTVRLEDGTEIAADAAVVGVGVQPRTELARAAGLAVDGGVLVDDRLRTGAHSIYAAGDVARYPDRLLGIRRVEHASAAETMGKVAGRNMAGADKPYRTTPFFWSDLFDYGYEAVGEVDTRHTTVEDWAAGADGDPDHSTGVVYYLNALGSVRGVLLWNVWDSVKQARELIARTADEPVADPGSLRGTIPLG
ncbi:FAD-dependent oxidoreductase [Citricoccus sp. NPDC055426]|uniref:FAD-dependent oxidoreductase n=1 Tax=Citricoccus sp. NPDC055426 TaxID=3155536 RepID=UPI00342A129A